MRMPAAGVACLAAGLLVCSAGARTEAVPRLVHTVPFSFDQDGVPKEEVPGHVRVQSRTSGAGTVKVFGALAAGRTGMHEFPTLLASGAQFEHVDRIVERGVTQTVRIMLKPSEPVLTLFADGSRQLNFEVAVIRSTDPQCQVGALGEAELQ